MTPLTPVRSPARGEGQGRRAAHRTGRALAFRSLFALLVFVLAGCGGIGPPATVQPITAIELPPAGTFSVTLTGAVDTTYSGQGQAVVDPAMGRAIYLSDGRYSANIVMPVDQAAGTYEVVPFLNAFNAAQDVASVGGVLTVADGAETPIVYDRLRAGRLTLLSVDPLSGAFEFTTYDDEDRAITVRAVFAELAPEPVAP